MIPTPKPLGYCTVLEAFFRRHTPTADTLPRRAAHFEHSERHLIARRGQQSIRCFWPLQSLIRTHSGSKNNHSLLLAVICQIGKMDEQTIT